MSQSTPKAAPPSLELDIGYSIPENKPSIKLKIPQGYFSGGRNPPLFPLRVWRVRLRGWCDARKGIYFITGQEPSIIEEIKHRGQLLFNELCTDFCEKIASEIPKLLQQLTPAPFSLEERKQALVSSIQGWLKGYEEALWRAKCDLDKAQQECIQADEALRKFATEQGVPRKPRGQRPWSKRVGTVLACVAAEALLGLTLFLPSVQKQGEGLSPGQGQTLAGGLIIALLISLSNAFLGWLMGFFAVHQLLDGVRRWHRVTGGVLAAVSTVAAIGTNLLVAHHREQSLGITGQTLPSTAFGGVLFVMGLCVWSFAAIKGYREFAPGKLGHRDLWEDWREKKFAVHVARARYRALLAGLQQSAEAIAHQLRAKLEDLVVKHEIRRDQIKGLLCDNDCLKARLGMCKRGVQGSVRVLLANYWEANYIRTKKGTQGGSGNLQEPPKDTWEPTGSYPLTSPDKTAEAAQNLITSNIEEIRELQVGFEEDFTEVLNKSIPDILAKFPAEKERVESLAPEPNNPQVVAPSDRFGATGASPISMKAS